VCLLLLDNGADVNATDAYGETPLMRAVEGQSAGICRLLLKRGADPSRFNHHG
jgi:ankyrin repeat protein